MFFAVRKIGEARRLEHLASQVLSILALNSVELRHQVVLACLRTLRAACIATSAADARASAAVSMHLIGYETSVPQADSRSIPQAELRGISLTLMSELLATLKSKARITLSDEIFGDLFTSASSLLKSVLGQDLPHVLTATIGIVEPLVTENGLAQVNPLCRVIEFLL